ncbi:hypothetical protein [Aliikangiella sp. IMCC44632]
MLSTKTKVAFSRRHSKTIVEIIIGVIGLLGIMVAQIDHTNKDFGLKERQFSQNVSELPPLQTPVNWLELLF